MKLKILVFLLPFCFFGISEAQKLPADLVIVNADIRTIDKTKPRAEAVAVTQNRISAVGTNAQIRALIGENTKVIDAGGKLVLPGFNDAHVHFTAMGRQFFSLDLREAKSAAEVVERIKFYVRFLPKGHWILGGGWNASNWSPAASPGRNLIDAATPEHPVFLYDSTAKAALVNTLALKSARIDKTAKDNGIIRDESGEPTGILKDSAINLVKRFVPQWTTENKSAVAETASNYAAAFGVTSVQDVSADYQPEIYRGLLRQGKLKTRIYDCAPLSDWRKLAQEKITKIAGDEFVRQGCLKGVADGDTDSTAQLYEEILAADRADLQVTVHAIGGAANAQVLSVFERVIKTSGKKDRRFRIEHAHGIRPADFRRFAASGVIASVQPFLFSDGVGRSFDPLRTLLANKTTLAFGSDSSMVAVNPLLGIAAAVNTSDPREKISVEEALRFYTTGAAFAEFKESAKGTITVGKLADLVILSDDIFTISPNEIRNVKVLKTIVDGRVVFETK